MAAAILWTLPILLIGTRITASPLPEGQSLLITTPDSARGLNGMMGDAPAMFGRVPQPKIETLQVHSEIKFRYAQTLVTSLIRNSASFSQHISFSVVLPQEAFITGFVMETLDKSYRAFLVDKSTAEAEYGKSVESKKTGAKLSYRDSNLFDISTNVDAYQQVMFKLSYEQLLTRQHGLYRHVITIEPGQVVTGMTVKVHIVEPLNITKVLVPAFAINNIGNKACAGSLMNATCVSDNEMVKKLVQSQNEVMLEFTPSVNEQKRLRQGIGRGMKGQVEVLYDVERDGSGGEILVKNGYFVHFFALPPGTTYLPKHVLFVLDVSGSMDGRKIQQVKDAMERILTDLSLRTDDFFNIILFSSSATAWGFGGVSDSTGNPQVAFPTTSQNIEDAKRRVSSMIANGGTNIFDALKKAVEIAKQEQLNHPNATKPVIFFLTDGEANEGISKPDEIISELNKVNPSPKIPIYSFAFGEAGNISFLERLSQANSGVARLIYTDSDANLQLKNAYGDISNAVLSNVTFKYLPEEVDLSSVTKLDYHTFFEGTELVVSGRTIDKNAKKILAEVTATGRGSSKKKFKVQSVVNPEPVYKMNASLISLADPNATTKTGSMERAWAYLTIKQLVENSKAASPDSKNAKLERAKQLATKYSFASEVTSFVIVKPGNQREVAQVKRIIHEENIPTTSSPISTTEEPDPVMVTFNYPLLQNVAHQKLPKFKLYNRGTLEDITWLPQKARTRGYVEFLNKNGSFSAYAILENVPQPQPEDEPNCAIDKLQGKCRHLSQCVMLEFAQDFLKYQYYYQCELEDYLAVCCPHK